MATVTGMTAVAMQAIRDGAIVSAAFDSANHLILTKHDGTTVDGGTLGVATTTLAGPVELATNAETQSGSSTTLAVTPAGLASVPGYKVQIVSGIAESATPSSWPNGSSLQSVSAGSGWTPNGGAGTIVTQSIDNTRTAQTFYENSGGTASTKAWVREYNSSVGGGGWTSWSQMMIMVNLTAANFSQSTTRGNYPQGLSRLYYTTATSTSWDFAGLAGEVITFVDGSDFGRQTFTQHLGGATKPVQWFRTATASGGWTPWQYVLTNPGAWTSWTPTWSTQTGLHLPSYGSGVTFDCSYSKIGRTVNCKFEVTFGSNTTFGSGVTGSDNWIFAVPVQAANAFGSIGWVQMRMNDLATAMARVRLYSTDYIILNVASGRADAVALTNVGDVDSITPWTWASGHSIKGTFTYESGT